MPGAAEEETWSQLAGAPGCGADGYETSAVGRCVPGAAGCASASSDPAPRGGGRGDGGRSASWGVGGRACGPDTRVNPLHEAHQGGPVGLSGHLGDTLTRPGLEELHSTPFYFITAYQLGRRGWGAAGTSWLSCEAAAPSGFSCCRLGSARLSNGWGVASSSLSPPLAAPHSSCLLMTKPANGLFVSAVRGISGWGFILACFSVNREGDGFDIMGFSQQLSSKQTCSKLGFLPALPPSPRDHLVSCQPGLEMDMVPIPSSTLTVYEKGLEKRSRGWPRPGQVYSSLLITGLSSTKPFPGNSPLKRKQRDSIIGQACPPPLSSVAKEAGSRKLNMNLLEIQVTLVLALLRPPQATRHLCAGRENVTTRVVCSAEAAQPWQGKHPASLCSSFSSFNILPLPTFKHKKLNQTLLTGKHSRRNPFQGQNLASCFLFQHP